MKDFIKNLESPFERISKGNEEKFKEECAKIAYKLFCDYCINCNDIRYYFAEIEFYYYEKGKWDKEWNKVTYARNGYKAGDLFYHLSGIDICFESYNNDNIIKYGGILIRAIKNEQGSMIVGPLTCKDKILNACKGGTMPTLVPLINKQSAKPMETYRYLGKDDFCKIMEGTNKDGHLKLAFYDSSVEEDLWNKTRSSYYSYRFKYAKQYQ